jgi:hypothetical protein
LFTFKDKEMEKLFGQMEIIMRGIGCKELSKIKKKFYFKFKKKIVNFSKKYKINFHNIYFFFLF